MLFRFSFLMMVYCLLLVSSVTFARQDQYVLVIHGGAGSVQRGTLSVEQENAVRETMHLALRTGHQMLEAGSSSIDAVEKVIQILEDSPLFNAGKGAVYTYDGKVELDASVMDGATGMAGAVAGVHTIRNPISAARAVMEQSPHVLLTGKGAADFAREKGLTIVDPAYFRTEAQDMKYARDTARRNKKVPGMGSIRQAAPETEMYGTVGCVALDRQGNLAAGTSTGGMFGKRYGRVGDSPLIGAGTYADNHTCAVSATGHGEYFIRGVIAYDIAALMAYKNMPVSAAASMAIDKLTAAGGTGGVIVLDKDGNFAFPFNTKSMYRGYIKADGRYEVLIYGD